MNKALLFKEWIKTRWMFLLMFVVFILAMGYIALRISSAARNVGMPHLWEVFILKNVVLLDQIKVLPLLAGIIMGITQFIPEMTKKRFKLTLHLPLGENRIVFLMLSYGMACLLLLFTVSYGGFLWDYPRISREKWSVHGSPRYSRKYYAVSHPICLRRGLFWNPCGASESIMP